MRVALAGLAALVVTAVLLPPLVFSTGSRVVGAPNDTTAGIRDYWSMERQGENPFTFRHDALLQAPEGTSYPPAVAIATGLTNGTIWVLAQLLGLVPAFNLFLLAGFVLTGAATFALLDRLGLHPLASAFGAYAFTFSGYALRKAEIGHGSLVHLWIFPVVVLAWLRLRERRTTGSAALVGVLLGAAFYLHAYYGAIAVVLVAVLALVDLVSRGERLQTVWLLDVALVVGALLFLPAAANLVRERDSVAATFGHRESAIDDFGADLRAYVLPPPTNPLLGDVVSAETRADIAADGGEPSLYVGWTTILLAAGGAWLLLGRGAFGGHRREVALAALVLVPVGLLLSLPTRAHVLGVALPTPTALAEELTTYLRVYARFGLLVGFGLAILAALALDALVRGRRRGAALAAGALVLVAVELAASVPSVDVDSPPPHVTWLASQERALTAIYPAPGDTRAEYLHTRMELFWQTRHGQPLFFTETARKGRPWAIRLLADQPELETTAELLAAEGVRRVLLVDPAYRAAGLRLLRLPPYLYRRVAGAGGGDARVYEVIAKPGKVDKILHDGAGRVAEAFGLPAPTATYRSGLAFYPEEQFEGRTWRWMTQDGVIDVENPSAELELELSVMAFSAGRPRRLTVLDEEGGVLGEALVGTIAAVHHIRPLRLPEGRSELHLVVTPGPLPLGGADTRRASLFLGPVAVQPYVDYSQR